LPKQQKRREFTFKKCVIGNQRMIIGPSQTPDKEQRSEQGMAWTNGNDQKYAPLQKTTGV